MGHLLRIGRQCKGMVMWWERSYGFNQKHLCQSYEAMLQLPVTIVSHLFRRRFIQFFLGIKSKQVKMVEVWE